ncbi:MAG: diguanylate cyclase [Bradymonadaceae bacterium]
MTSDPSDGPDTGEATAVVNVESLQDHSAASGREHTACLTIMTGPHVGRMITLEKGEITAGRGRGCDLRIPDEKVSRQHARFFWADEQVMVRDLDSSNGTFVEGDRVPEETSLRDGDKVALGNSVMLKFALQDPVEQSFQEQMYEASLRDGLTQAYNKSFLTDHVQSEISFAERHETNLGMILFDLDHFKEINDTYGHVAGDAILREISDISRESVRTEDVFARYGGEEFAAVLRDVDREGARVLAERLRRLIEQDPFEFEDKKIQVTISAGVATYHDISRIAQGIDRGRRRGALSGQGERAQQGLSVPPGMTHSRFIPSPPIGFFIPTC